MSISITLNSATLTDPEAGAVVALLMALHPDAVQAALERMDEPEPQLAPGDAVPVWRPAPCAPEAAFGSGAEGLATLVAAEVLAEPRPDEPLTPEAAFGSGAGPFVPADGSTATSSASPSDVDLDAEGLPWDGRIHSSNRKRSANGVWMKRRALNQLVEQKVRAELRETYPVPETPAKRTLREAVAAGLVSPPEAGAPIPAAAPPPPAAAPAPPAPAPTTAAAPPPAPAPTGASGPDQFAEAMKVATAAQAQGVITAADTIAIATGLGLTSLRDLVAPANAAFIPQFRAGLDALIAERGAA